MVLNDRNPDRSLLPWSGDWAIGVAMTAFPWTDVDATNFEQMTTGVKPVPPTQPTLVARDVSQILPSRFAGTITIYAAGKSDKKGKDKTAGGENEEPSDESAAPETSTTEHGGYGPMSDKTQPAGSSPSSVGYFGQTR